MLNTMLLLDCRSSSTKPDHTVTSSPENPVPHLVHRKLDYDMVQSHLPADDSGLVQQRTLDYDMVQSHRPADDSGLVQQRMLDYDMVQSHLPADPSGKQEHLQRYLQSISQMPALGKVC